MPTPKSILNQIETYKGNAIVVPHSIARFSGLSFAARGLLFYIASTPGWESNPGSLEENGGIGREDVRKLMHEISDFLPAN